MTVKLTQPLIKMASFVIFLIFSSDCCWFLFGLISYRFFFDSFKILTFLWFLVYTENTEMQKALSMASPLVFFFFH